MIKPIDNEILKCMRDALAFIDAELEADAEQEGDLNRNAMMRVEREILKSMVNCRTRVLNILAVQRRR